MPPKRKETADTRIQQRNGAIQSLKRIRDMIDNTGESLSTTDLQCRLDLVEGYFSDVREHQAMLEQLQFEPELTNAENIRSEFENVYCEVKSKILSLIAEKSALSTTKLPTNVKTLVGTDNLPKLKLPQFSGKYAEYQNFMHLFTTLVDNNENLTEIEKYNHLLSCLSGSALRTVKALDLSAENYATALTLLKSRFDNKFLMCQEHIKELFSLQKVQKGSPENLRLLVDNISAHFNALCALISHEEIANALIVHLALSSMDVDTQSKVEEAINYNEPFNWSDCVQVLNKRCQMLETRCNKSNVNAQNQPYNTLSHNKFNNPKIQKVSLTTTTTNCSFCKQINHQIWKCTKFLELQPMQRFDAIKRLALCINCFSNQHTVKQCKSSSCKQCNGMHHTLLHRGNSTNSSGNQHQQQLSLQQQQLQMPSSSSQLQAPEASGFVDATRTSLISQHQSSQQNSSQFSSNSNSLPILGTAIVEVTDRYGNKHKARALLDSASQSNFMTQSLANLLKLEKHRTNAVIGGIGESEMCAKYSTTTQISSHCTNFVKSLNFAILPKITGAQPNRKISIISWNIPQHVHLADEKFNIPQHIDILIGADTFYQLLHNNKIELGPELPTLIETQFGWIVAGKCNALTNHKSVFIATANEEGTALEALVQKFWELEAVPEANRKLSKEQARCEEHFLQTTKRADSGRFMVKLPLKQSASVLGSSKDMAIRRFHHQEKRLQNNSELKAAYSEFLKIYEDEGHMQQTVWPNPDSDCYFMPHHCVLRPEKTTTKCRVVFDASAKAANNLSLNNILMIGPVVQSDLLDVLLRFRFHRYALMADVTAMYRQILVYPQDQNLQHIVWRSNVNDDLQVYKLKTVTYGTASAPYLATRCLVQLAEENSKTHPAAANIVKNDFYVDDLITGGSTLEEICDIKEQVSYITAQGGFQLKKWYSNHQEFLDALQPDEREKPITINNTNVVKALGLIWDASSDNFKFQYSSHSNEAITLTKRKVLSELAKLFDPLGLIKPAITKAKIFMQELWLKKIGWDDIIPEHEANLWVEFVKQLASLNNIKIPRYVLQQNSTVELHGFGDASTRAYGCCFYIRCTDANGNVKVSLFTSKSKVAPISTVRSVPCLELCAAHLMSQMLGKLWKMFNFQLIIMWSDNITVLSWIAEHSSNFNTFVANRVAYIQEHTAGVTWRYVPSASNPADIVSRGALIEELLTSIWFSGPTFLQQSPEHWPANPRKWQLEELPQRKAIKTVLLASQGNSFFDTIHTTNDFVKLCKRVAYIRRFIKNCRSPSHRATTEALELTATELDEAFIQLIFIVQQMYFKTEIKQLHQTHQVNQSSTLKNLNPFLEEVYGLQLLKVGGRLRHAELPYDTKCPILLPRRNGFVHNYVQHLHKTNLHAGPQALLCLIRQRFWIIGGREYARKIVQKCIHCFKYKPRMLSQIMGDLPKDRVTTANPFTHCGVDFCGPILTTWRVRGAARYKTYVAVFVCFVTRAVHLEVVSNLTAFAFIAALKRFIGRRGRCSTLYLDNATNFVGARNQLKEFKEAFLNQNVQKELMNWCSINNINFKHIPPRSPHFGGLWEAAVKSAKNILYKTMQSAVLTFEELTTVIAQIEGILNSRPLAAMSTDPSDERVLTPAHFLNHASSGCLVEPVQSFVNISRLKVWQQITAMQQHFWTRWSREYITSLQQRHKWSSDKSNLALGDLVLIHEDGLPPQKWVTGRVINVVPGQDGKIRVADIKTPHGTFRRAITKLAALPMD